MMSLLMVWADPGWLKKGLTSYRQSPTTSSLSLSSKINLEGSSETSTKNTSLMLVSDSAGAVLHLAIWPREMWQERGPSMDGAVNFSIKI